jgi:hypothetical protein
LFQFLNPVWLFAAAAVVIPVAIHLWNIRPGKILKVGSISLIDTASRKSRRSFKLLDIPLFILRCLMLILLALLLAVPTWQKMPNPINVKGWLLIPKESFEECYKKFGRRIDSLHNAGYEFHYFNQDFPKADLKQILSHPQDSTSRDIIDKQPANYWNLIRLLDAKVSSALPVCLITPNQARYFIGEKPQVSLNIQWQSYTPADSTVTWIAGAWFNNNNNVSILQGASKSSGTAYSYQTAQPGSPFAVSINNGQPVVNVKTGLQQPVNIDTTTLRIAIYSDNNITDAAYLKAALMAANTFIQHKTIIKQYNSPEAIASKQDWLFWLSEKPVSTNIIQQCNNVLYYEKGKIINKDSWLINSDQFAVALKQEQHISLFKFVEAQPSNNAVVWHDGFGNPVLTLQGLGKNNIYHFYNRFSPTWSDLVWNSEFPSWVLQLITRGKTPAMDKYDRRTLSSEQLAPGHIDEIHAADVKTTETFNIANYFWLALTLLFLAERWLAGRTQNITGNG